MVSKRKCAFEGIFIRVRVSLFKEVLSVRVRFRPTFGWAVLWPRLIPAFILGAFFDLDLYFYFPRPLKKDKITPPYTPSFKLLSNPSLTKLNKYMTL